MHALEGFADQIPVDFEFFGYHMSFPSRHPLIKMFTPGSDDYQPYRESGLIAICEALSMIGSDGTIIDVGANVGDSLAIIARKSECRVVCVEASDFFISYLTTNVNRHFKDRASIIHALLVDTTNESTLKGLEHGGGSARQVDIPFTEKCSAMSLEVIVRNTHNVSLLKLDIDGNDMSVINSLLRKRDANGFAPPIAFPIYFEFEFKGLDRATARSDALDLTELLSNLHSQGYAYLFLWDAVGRFYGGLDIKDARAIANAINYMYHPEHQCVWGFDICAVHRSDAALRTALSSILQANHLIEPADSQVNEAVYREEALRWVLDALLASTGWRGFNRKRFKALIADESRRTPNNGLSSVKHFVLRDEAQRILSKNR